MLLDIKTYKTSTEGPIIGFIGGIHGNEICGVEAINKIIKQIDNCEINLKVGEIKFLPIANPEAYKAKKRFCEINLNRVFIKKEDPKLYEEKLAQEVIKFIESCDVIIDLHSNHVGGEPFVFQDFSDDKSTALINDLPIKAIMKGWVELYGESEDTTSIDYTYEVGKYGVTIECGAHDDPSSIDVAYKCIIASLQHFNAIDIVEDISIEKQYMTLQSFISMPKGGKFIKDWLHGDIVKKDEEIGTDSEGNIYKSDNEGFICLPFADAEEGSEWFYLAS